MFHNIWPRTSWLLPIDSRLNVFSPLANCIYVGSYHFPKIFDSFDTYLFEFLTHCHGLRNKVSETGRYVKKCNTQGGNFFSLCVCIHYADWKMLRDGLLIVQASVQSISGSSIFGQTSFWATNCPSSEISVSAPKRCLIYHCTNCWHLLLL